MPERLEHNYKGVDFIEDDGVFYVEIGDEIREFGSLTGAKGAITKMLKAENSNEPEESEESDEPEKANETETKEETRKGGKVTVISLPMKESGRKEGRSSGILFVDGEAELPEEKALEMCQKFPNSYQLKE